MDIYEQSKTEESFSQQIQRAALYKIERRKYDEKTLAEKLGLLPIGAKNLLGQKEWDIRMAIHIAEALGLRMRIEFF